MDTVLQTYGLTKTYSRKKVVNNINLTLNRGDIYGLIGRNGAGKTTFMRLVLGLAIPDSGKVELFGGEDHETAGQKIGSIIEAPAIYGGCTAFENLKRFSLLLKEKQIEDAELNKLIDMVGLTDAAAKKAGHYSLGMKQRLGLAIAMLGNPELMILDEPVNGLDPAGIKDIRDAINTLNSERGVSFLISSHLLDELSKTVSKYGIMNDGLLVEEITSAELADKNKSAVSITVDQPTLACNLLKKFVPEEDIIVSGNVINVYNHSAYAADLNKLLVAGGIAVSALGTSSFSIENYFIERMGS